jgi:hypothetical protein
MYFNNLVRLASNHLKSFIPKNKEELVVYVESSEDKNTPKHALNWLRIMQQTSPSSENLQQQISLISSFIATNLSIDAWYTSIEYKNIGNQKHIEFIANLLQMDNFSFEQALSEDNYHALQTELFNFSKALLYSMRAKKHTHNYSPQHFQSWLSLV